MILSLLLLIKLAAMYLGALPACAQTAGAAHLLSRGPGAEAAALGGSVAPIVRDPSALYWNPAGLANAGGMLTGEHLFIHNGARYNFTGLSVPSGLGTFGLGALQLSRGDIVGRTAIDDPGTRLSNTQTSFLAGFARRIGRRFAAGGTANILHFNLAGKRDMALGLDLGGQAFLPSADLWPFRGPFWSFGAVLKNLLEPKVTLADAKEVLPRELRAGLSLSFKTVSRASFGSGVIRHDRAALMASLKKVAGEPGLHPGLGLSYSYEDLLVLRVGYNAGVSGGVGLRTGGGRFSVDYALEHRPLSKNHRFTVSYRFLEPGAQPLEAVSEKDDDYARALARARSLSHEHYLKGQAEFKGPEFHEALEPLRLAALLAPDDPEKAAFYERALEVARREKLRLLAAEYEQSLSRGDNATAYKALARMLPLAPTDKDDLVHVMRKLVGRMDELGLSPAAGEVLHERREAALRFASAGLMSDAVRVVEWLEVSQASATPAVEELKARVTAQARGLRTRLEAEASQAAAAGDLGKAYRAAAALKRAFPGDPDVAARLESVRTRAAAGPALDLRERLYLRRLYLLAAVQYANGNVEGASDMINEVLRRAPADGPACAMERAMAEAMVKEAEVQ